jgi:hypothetical protein
MLNGVGDALERAMPSAEARPTTAAVVGGATLVCWVVAGLVLLVQIVAT